MVALISDCNGRRVKQGDWVAWVNPKGRMQKAVVAGIGFTGPISVVVIMTEEIALIIPSKDTATFPKIAENEEAEDDDYRGADAD